MMVQTDRHSKHDTNLQNPSMLSHNTPTYGLTPYLDKHIKWGFIPYNNAVVNRVYDYPQWVKEVSQEGMEDK